MKIYEIGTGYTPIPAKVPAATESVVEELTKAFIEMGENVEIIDIRAESRIPHKLPIAEVKVPSIFTKSDVSLGIVHKLKRVIYSISLSFTLKKILKKTEEKTILHFHNQYNMFFFTKLVSKKLRSKAVLAYTNHNGVWSLPISESESILKKKYFQEISSMKRADIIFALNHKTKKNIIEYLKIDNEKIYVIANGVNTEIYSPCESGDKEKTKASVGLTDKKVILQVGSVYENKGQARAVEMLADLLKKNKDVVYAFAGDIVSQEYYDKIKETAKSLGIEESVVHLGSVSPGKEMNKLYNIADATIFLSRYESFGLVCIESLSAGVPVILASPSLESFGDGCIMASHETVCDEIENKILTKDNEYVSLCEKSRKTAIEQYIWNKIAKDYLNVFSGK